MKNSPGYTGSVKYSDLLVSVIRDDHVKDNDEDIPDLLVCFIRDDHIQDKDKDKDNPDLLVGVIRDDHVEGPGRAADDSRATVRVFLGFVHVLEEGAAMEQDQDTGEEDVSNRRLYQDIRYRKRSKQETRYRSRKQSVSSLAL